MFCGWVSEVQELRCDGEVEVLEGKRETCGFQSHKYVDHEPLHASTYGVSGTT